MKFEWGVGPKWQRPLKTKIFLSKWHHITLITIVALGMTGISILAFFGVFRGVENIFQFLVGSLFASVFGIFALIAFVVIIKSLKMK